MKFLFHRLITVSPWNIMKSIFVVYSVIYTISNSLTYYLKIEMNGAKPFLFFGFISIVIGIYRSLRPCKVNFRIKTTDTNIEILFGDIFRLNGQRVIPVNEFFDTEIGECVSSKSLHGQFITKYYKNDVPKLDFLIEESLKGVSCDDVKRTKGKTRCYPIGTTATVVVSGVKFFLVALSKTNLATFKAYAKILDLWNALLGGWDTVRSHSEGQAVLVPLIGSGLSGVGLPPSQLLQLIILSIVSESKKEKVTRLIKIVLPIDLIKEIDLKPIKEEWS